MPPAFLWRSVLVQAIDRRDSARATARLYESTLPAEQRKALGQFFTGLPLGKLLAHLSLDSGTKTVLDPMAGHGDLLDAVWEAARGPGYRHRKTRWNRD